VSKDRQQELGDEVGYQIRFINKFSENTRLIYATTAIVLRRLHSEPTLDSIGCLIIDEVHERDVYTDFLLLLIKEAMLNGKMQHLKIVLMSATVKAEDFAEYFKKVNGQAALKPVNIPGRMFPVQDYYFEDACEWVGWCPPEKGGGKGGKKGNKGSSRGDAEEGIEAAYQAIKKYDISKDRLGKDRADEYGEKALQACARWREHEVYVDLVEHLVHYFHKEQPMGDGAILIFLPGWGDITKTYIRLYQSGENFQLITLHSLMTPEQQHEAFQPPPEGFRKIVLSTNIAEASVTIDDVVYVIDTGVRKERTFDPSTSTSSLDTKMVTRANAIQRRGRAGRCQEGMVVHCFPSYKFTTFEDFPLPQMLTSSMEEVVLQSKVIHGGSNTEISSMLTNSMAAPKSEAVDSAVLSLKNMNCLTYGGELTVLGRAVAAIPVDPKVAKFLLIAGAFRCIKPAAVIAAFLSIKSPFQQTVGSEKNEKSASKQPTGKDYFNKGFASDHITNVQAYVEWRREVLRGNGDDFCDQQGLSPETLDMAYMMVQQFVSFMVDAGYDGTDVTGEGDLAEVDPVKKASDEDALVRAAMVAGFQPSVAVLYRGQRSPYWYLSSNEEVSPFRGSANADYQMNGQDGDEWMTFSDSMKMGRFNSIMDSSLVFSPFILLFANALIVNEQKGEASVFQMHLHCTTFSH
jgi:ATP-dependent RNA helicase DHX36